MRKTLVAAFAAVLIIVIVGGYVGWTYLNQNQNSDDNQLLDTDSLTAQIRDQAMVYIEANNTQTVQLMQNLAWSGGKQEVQGLGAETYLYTSGNWAVQIQYPIVPNPIYTITANYTSGDVKVVWVGACQNSPIEETSKTINVPVDQTIPVQEQIRDITMAYIKAYHTKTAPYMQGFMWSGGRMGNGMMVGSDTYSYMSGGSAGWTVTMQNPVVPNPVYGVNATYSSPANMNGIMWRGTIQSGVITETNYQFKP